MSAVTGLVLGLSVMVLGALGMTLFAMFLANREKPRCDANAPVPLTRSEAWCWSS